MMNSFYGCQQSNLIAIMQEIQAEYKYLSEEALTLVAEKLGISTAKVYSVATFYENFSLEAKGRHIVKVCAAGAAPLNSKVSLSSHVMLPTSPGFMRTLPPPAMSGVRLCTMKENVSVLPLRVTHFSTMRRRDSALTVVSAARLRLPSTTVTR